MKGSLNALRETGKRTNEVLDLVVQTRVKHILGTIVVGFLCFGLISVQYGSILANNRASDLRDTNFATYQVQLDTYRTALTQYEQCLTRIEVRTIYRERFIVANQTKVKIIDAFRGDREPSPEQVEVYRILDEELAGINEGLPVLERSTCPPYPPVAPTPVLNPANEES